MIQLSYQPALDPFHAVFRLIRILPTIKRVVALPRDHVRILDFYLVFPFRISGIRLTPKHRRFRQLSADYEELRPYGEQPDDLAMFSRMQPMQVAALETLANTGLIDPDRWRAGVVETTSVRPPAALAERADQKNSLEPLLVEFVDVLSSEYALLGQNGLKDRTQLMEYRYDAV